MLELPPTFFQSYEVVSSPSEDITFTVITATHPTQPL